MGMLKRMLVPRSVRRATHPARVARRAVTPRLIRKAQYTLHTVKHPTRHIVYKITKL